MGKPTSLLNLQEFADTFLSSGGGRSNLRILIDMRAHVQRMRIRAKNNLHAKLLGDDTSNPAAIAVMSMIFDEFKASEAVIDRLVEMCCWNNPMYHHLTQLHSIGPITAGCFIAMVDPERMVHASSLWKFCGLACRDDGTRDRKIAGQKLEYSQFMKSRMFVVGTGMLMGRKSPYVGLYHEERNVQESLIAARAENAPENDFHAHLRAMRRMMKVFVTHVYEVYRLSNGLEISEPFPCTRDGHSTKYMREDFGWHLPMDFVPKPKAWRGLPFGTLGEAFREMTTVLHDDDDVIEEVDRGSGKTVAANSPTNRPAPSPVPQRAPRVTGAKVIRRPPPEVDLSWQDAARMRREAEKAGVTEKRAKRGAKGGAEQSA